MYIEHGDGQGCGQRSVVGLSHPRKPAVEVEGGGGEEAWREFYAIYGRLIFGYTLHFDLSHAEAEDIVQDVCVKVFRQIAQFDYSPARGRFRGWLKTATRNTVIDHLRRKQNRRNALDGFGAKRQLELEEDSMADEALWHAEWEKALFEAALERVRARVGEKTFHAFKRYVLDGQPVADVANETALDANAVYAVKHRVVKFIRAEVAAILKDE